MKKRIILGVVVVFLPLLSFSQKHDAVWIMGYAGGSLSPNNDTFGISILDFNAQPAPAMYDNQDIEMSFSFACTAMSDSLGNLQFYSNGIEVFSKNHQLMENGGNMDVDEFGWNASLVHQGLLSLPFPENPLQYAIFQLTDTLYLTDEISVAGYHLYYSVIDMSLKDGFGAVVEKKTRLISDTLDIGKLTAVKHGNGRDWWILVPEYATLDRAVGIYKILFTPEGIGKITKQKLEIPYQSGGGQNVFSPDGRKYVSINADLWWEDSWLNIFDFNRCTGQLSNQVLIRTPRIGESIGTSVMMSPNSRFLYAVAGTQILQYDLKADDIEGSMQVVGTWDNYYEPHTTFAVDFDYGQLAPDGKIYLSSIGSRWMHVIHNPNEPSMACNFEQRAFRLPTYNDGTVPNFPNYRLQEWEDNPCDTLSQDTVVSTKDVFQEERREEVVIYPNPVQVGHPIQVTPDEWTVTAVYDVYGRVVSRKRILLNVPGVYYVNLENDSQRVVKKLLVLQE